MQPWADPAQIRLRYRGATGVSLNTAGQLEVTTPLGGLTDDAPVAWQEIDSHRVPVSVTFDLGMTHATRNTQYAIGYQPSATGQSQAFGFSLGVYDRSQPLVIDPVVLVYCGYIGGSSSDWGTGIAVDGAGNAYVTGSTNSTQDSFPETVGPDLTYNGGTCGAPPNTYPCYDAFVAKVDASGESLVYAGYIGGSGGDYGYGIAVDGNGNAYITGHTDSTQDSFPVTGGPDVTFNGEADAFVAMVSASGAALVYAGYIGGLNWDYGTAIATDGAGNVYVTGWTNSDQTSFPVTGGPDLTYNGYPDAFVARVSPSGAALVYAGYIGGSGGDYGNGIAVDGAGNAYVTGETSSTQESFPETLGPYLTYNGGEADAFVAKVSASGAALAYAGYIGGSGRDYGRGIAVDDAGKAYVTGHTDSTQYSFPVMGGPDLTHNGGVWDAFVAKVSSSGAALVYAGYIGGSRQDYGGGIAADGAGNAYVTGHTDSTQGTFPVTGGPDLTQNGSLDAFVAKVSPSGAALIYAGYIGGSGGDYGSGIAVDGAGNAYVTGSTTSTQDTFPVTGGPDLTHNGSNDAFVAKVGVAVEFDEYLYLPLVVRGK